MDIYLVVMWMSFFCSLVGWYFVRSGRSRFLKWFTPFLFSTALVETIANKMAYRGIPNLWIYNFFSVVEFTFYFLFFYFQLRGDNTKRTVLATVYVYPIVALVNIIFFQGNNSQGLHTYTVMLGAILIVVFCMTYFYQVLRFPEMASLVRVPAFWIIAGLLFFYACTFVTVSLTNYFIELRYYSGILDSIMQLANVFLYILISIGLLCTLKVRKSLA